MKATVDFKEFKRVVKALKPFTKENEEKMQYIYLEINSEAQEIRMEALDGHRIAVEYIKCQADESFTAYIKPLTFIKSAWDKVEISKDKNYVVIDMLDYYIRVKQPEGEWYQTKRIVSEAEKETAVLKVGVNADFLIDALKDIQRSKSGKNMALIECRNKKSPIFIRDENDRRNLRMVLPMTFSDRD
jgi:DNA polymerase III sliding clamp (beta) subunit (PCNA family)